MHRFVALLRGINVGGNKKVPMVVLKKALEKAGFENVKTLLASGNVVLESSLKTPAQVGKAVETVIEDTFGFSSAVIVRTKADLEKLEKLHPFKGIKVTKDTRLYVSFLANRPTAKLKLPHVVDDGAYTILRVTDGEICSVLDLSKGLGTVDSMAMLEKTFGKGITTRNWNTVEKLLKL